MQTGTVKFFDTTRSFGFIAGGDGQDYFVHSSGIKEGNTLEEEDKVKFKVVKSDRGPKAENVKKVE
ncbi:MAG: cold shock domain-containing protein [Candidatus Woesearchaeota archaeon]|nr:MAG: cold shock domain-containing protein [Candidatus Woesearchaeota archaeon]